MIHSTEALTKARIRCALMLLLSEGRQAWLLKSYQILTNARKALAGLTPVTTEPKVMTYVASNKQIVEY